MLMKCFWSLLLESLSLLVDLVEILRQRKKKHVIVLPSSRWSLCEPKRSLKRLFKNKDLLLLKNTVPCPDLSVTSFSRKCHVQFVLPVLRGGAFAHTSA